MQRVFRILFFCLLNMATISIAQAQSYDYVWLTDRETSPDGTRHPWQLGDTIVGAVRSNDTISIMYHPVFYGCVMTTASDFWHGPGYDPQFIGCQPQFNAPRFPLTESMENIQMGAAQQGNYYNYPGKTYRAYFQGSQIRMYKWRIGTEFDSRDNWVINIAQGGPATPGTCIFINGPVEVLGDTNNNGAFRGKVTLGAAGNIRIMDNIRYASSEWPSGIVINPSSHDVLGIISEGDILIANTPANGRWNSGMPNGTSGNQQNDTRRTDITITGVFVSVNGSFTYEQQNDPEDWYVCDCQPDDRGTINLFGAIWQRQRGFLHRSTNFSTGYLTKLRYDQRFDLLRPPCFFDMTPPNPPNTDTLDFGNVAVGTTVWDTAHVYTSWPVNIGLVMATYPYYAVRPEPMYNSHFRIPVRFTPPRAEPFLGYLSVSLPGNFLQIVLLGRGVHAAAPPLTMDVAPNPFNSATLLRYDLTEAADVRVMIYDLLGRVVQEIRLDQQPAGSHLVRLDGERWASGVYFTTLHVNGQTVTRKMLLLK
jgi:hypothetical protein